MKIAIYCIGPLLALASAGCGGCDNGKGNEDADASEQAPDAQPEIADGSDQPREDDSTQDTSEGVNPCQDHCSNGIQDCGETGVDCGGPCAACPVPPPAPTWLLALPKGSGLVYLGWRLDSQNPTIGYNLYRSTTSGSGYTKINTDPVTTSTNYIDSTVSDGATYYYVARAVDGGGAESPDSNEARVTAANLDDKVYKRLDNLQSDTYNLSMRVGDVDGDRMMDFMFRLQPGADNCADEAVQVKVYRSDGSTPLWSLDSNVCTHGGYLCTDWCDWECDPGCSSVPGHECSTDPRCCHGTQCAFTDWINWVNWTLWDLNEDGKAEVFGLLRDNSTNVISVRNGETGTVMGNPIPLASADTQEFIVAYLDGVHPSLVVQSREYPPSVVSVYDGNLNFQWSFTSQDDACHQLRVDDLDDDGKDEILDGAQAIDHDGADIWHRSYGHIDDISTGDVSPDDQHPGLEVVTWGETNPGVGLLRATDGYEYWYVPNIHGGGWAADVRPDYPGMEIWALQPFDVQNLYSSSGTLIQWTGMSTPTIDWDGDAYKEVILNGSICNGQTLQAIQGGASGIMIYTLDMMGDYREELLILNQDGGNAYLQIYTNTELNGQRAPSPWETRPYGQNKQRTRLHEGLGM